MTSPRPHWKRPYLLAFGRHLRVLRQERGLSRGDLGRMLGSNRSLIRALEEGMQAASPRMMAKLALALGMPLADLVPEGYGLPDVPVDLPPLMPAPAQLEPAPYSTARPRFRRPWPIRQP